MIILRFMLLFLYLFLNAPAEATRLSSQMTRCGDGFGLNYTLPMFDQCKEKEYKNGSMIQTIPKLIPSSPAEEVHCRRKSKIGIPPGRRVCRLPDFLSNPCVTGWFEETMTDYQCHCPPGYSGKRCQKTTGLGSAKEEPGLTSTDASSDTDTAISTTTDAVKAASQPDCNATTSSNNGKDPCPQSWQQFEGYCYHYYYNECVSFHEAMNRCRTCGHADLASIHSEQENDFIRMLSQPLSREGCGSKHPWIGFYQRNGSFSDDQFIWSDGTAVDFQYWAGKQPDNRGGEEDCATFWSSLKVWNDVPCESRKSYVCKTRAMNKK